MKPALVAAPAVGAAEAPKEIPDDDSTLVVVVAPDVLELEELVALAVRQ